MPMLGVGMWITVSMATSADLRGHGTPNRSNRAAEFLSPRWGWSVWSVLVQGLTPLAIHFRSYGAGCPLCATRRGECS